MLRPRGLPQLSDDAEPRLDGCHLLVLDDECLICMDVACTLEDAGASVVEAYNAPSALLSLDRMQACGRLTAAVLDVNLGDHTCQIVAERLQALGIPFVLHTGNLQGRGELVDILGAPIVSKPAKPGEIVTVLRQSISGSAVH